LTLNAKQTILKMQSAHCIVGGELLKTKIQELRKKHRISQEELAQAVGVTRQTITSLECEKYTASLVLAYKIAQYFHLTIEDIFDFSDVEDV
jgi:putative transcriptional regulator